MSFYNKQISYTLDIIRNNKSLSHDEKYEELLGVFDIAKAAASVIAYEVVDDERTKPASLVVQSLEIQA